MMPQLLHVRRGLARPVVESILAQGNWTNET